MLLNFLTAGLAHGMPLPEGADRLRSHPVALRRFRPPANAAIFISADRHLHSDKFSGQIVGENGPYLLSGNWWDENSWARAEWDMELERGELIRAHETGNKWVIDGVYD